MATTHITGNERRRVLAALVEMEGDGEIVAGPRSVGRPKAEELESVIKNLLKGQEPRVLTVASMIMLNGFTFEHAAGKLGLPVDEIKKSLVTALKIIKQKIEKPQ